MKSVLSRQPRCSVAYWGQLLSLWLAFGMQVGGSEHPAQPSHAPEASAPKPKAATASPQKPAPAEAAAAGKAVPTRINSTTNSGQVWQSLTNDLMQLVQAKPDGTHDQPAGHGHPADGTDPALKRTAELLANSNVVTRSQSEKALTDYGMALAAARRLVQQSGSQQAVPALVNLMKSDAPESIKRSALLELAQLAYADKQFTRALQIYSQFVQTFPEDANVPEIYLRQGLIYRDMGAHQMALTKFHAVMSSALNLNTERLDYYQQLVLLAQVQIAETYYNQGRHEDAVGYFLRLLKLNNPSLNKAGIQYTLIDSLSKLGRNPDTVAQAQDYLERFPGAAHEPEVRFQLARALKAVGRNRESLHQVMLLLESQRRAAKANPTDWLYWQQRAGNEIANQLYNEGSYASALEIYTSLAALDTSVAWQLPAYYQVGLVCERMEAPQKATEAYEKILKRADEVATNGTPGLKAVLEMAKWRQGFLAWQQNQHQTKAQLTSGAVSSPAVPAK